MVGLACRKYAGAGSGGIPASSRSFRCPYLDTINRPLLDFDFEKVCSVSLSNHNVYGCLVCGKFFQGRGHQTHAYTHSVHASHHVFINLATGLVYCLPGTGAATRCRCWGVHAFPVSLPTVLNGYGCFRHLLPPPSPLMSLAADMYEVIDSSLSDIKYALDPSYTLDEIEKLDQRSTLATDVMGVKYLPGTWCSFGWTCACVV